MQKNYYLELLAFLFKIANFQGQDFIIYDSGNFARIKYNSFTNVLFLNLPDANCKRQILRDTQTPLSGFLQFIVTEL